MEDRLKDIALAAKNTFSPTCISRHWLRQYPRQKNLSWRVAILPYLDEEAKALYKEFDLSQPWDHPTNKKLIAKMPAVYSMPSLAPKEGMTHFRAFDGKGTPMESGAKRMIEQFEDETMNTVLVVEAAEPTIWTKPDDLFVDAKSALPKFGVSSKGFMSPCATGLFNSSNCR